MKTHRGLMAGLLLVLTTAPLPAGPSKPGRVLTVAERKEVGRLNAEVNRHVVAGRFEDAVKIIKRIVDYRAERQGASDWRVITARLRVEELQRWTSVPAKDRAEVVRALRAQGEGNGLQRRLRYREAETKFREALAICRKALGEQHTQTATSYSYLASCLDSQDKYAEALPLYQKALAIRHKTLGEQHPRTAASYNSVAACLIAQVKYAEALPLYHKALAIRRKTLGEQHPQTAASYNNLASCLDSQGKYAEALPFYHKALAIRRKTLGEQHPRTAASYNNVAFCLSAQGMYAEALPLHQKALAIRRKTLGEQHPRTSASYNGVAFCLNAQGKSAEALPLLQKALAIDRKTRGEQHRDTATSYANVAACLDALGKYAEALPLHQKALAILRKTRGEQHPDTARSYDNVAGCLNAQGKYAESLPLYHKALAILRKTLGEQHPDTALSYNNVAFCLNAQGKYAEALLLFHKALAIHLKARGEQHPDTARSYNNVAFCLSAQGKYAEALPLYHKALAIHLKALGEQHPHTALSYASVASCLGGQGKYAEALPLYQKALAILRQSRGEQHPHTALSYNNVASCLNALGKYAEALPLHHKALAIYRKALGEQHPNTAQIYNYLAGCLSAQGMYAEALPLHQKALAIHLKALGEQHPRTAASYNNVAFCLNAQGKYAEALPLFQKALALRRKTLGEQHLDTAQSYNNVAFCLNAQGKYAEAARYWQKALLGHEYGRLQASATGFDRSLFRVEYASPHAALAGCLVQLGQPLQAWEHAEANLARGLLDDLLPSAATTADADRRAHLDKLNQALLPLLTLEKPTVEQIKQQDALAKERDALLAELAANAARRSRERVLSLARIQKQIPADAALVFWLDVLGQHLGCVLRRQGPPVWCSLPGSGKDNAWGNDDASLPRRTLDILADAHGEAGARRRLVTQLYRQRLAPLEPHLKGVRQLLVVPVGMMAAVPVEALTDRYTISYVPSASVFARGAERHRPLEPTSLLVLADPLFTRTAPKLPPAPPHGLLILAVTPRSLAARIGLRPGDVLLEYHGKKLTVPADLTPPDGNDRVSLKLWRDGKTGAGRIPAGKLGVVVDKRPVAEALTAWRKRERDLLALGRGDDWQALPGTRLEARVLASLIPRSTILLGSDASQQKLAELAAADQLKTFRLLHLATHGQANTVRPELTALILAQDRIDDATAAANAVLAGKKPVDGRLTVGIILADWQLDADLVVLSACQTGLGKASSGEGMLGFTQALLQKGARSVLLSRWKVDDAATSLLMARFYENLMGSRKGTKPLGRAAALTEAKTWLRKLRRVEATERLAALVDGVPRGERGSLKAALPTRTAEGLAGEDHPFATPYFWAAFVLLGDAR